MANVYIRCCWWDCLPVYSTMKQYISKIACLDILSIIQNIYFVFSSVGDAIMS